MEHDEVRKRLHRYFDGITSLAEEQNLRMYFLSEKNIPKDLQRYKPLFVYQHKARLESLQKDKRKNRPALWFAAVAASLTFFVLLSPPDKPSNTETLSAAQQEELMEMYKHFKLNLEVVSINYNKGASNISYLSYWNETTEKLLK